MNREQKQHEVESIKKIFDEAGSIFLVDFRGLKVNDATELRRHVRETESEYRVVKNTLALRALKGSSFEELADHFVGPTAVVFTGKDPVKLAKSLTGYAKEHPTLVFKVAVVEGQVITEKEIKTVAELPSKKELQAKLLFMLSSPMRQLVTVLSASQRNLLNVLKAKADKTS
ncbi:50S ribosomal protein L10 [Acidobacteriota bacterium]